MLGIEYDSIWALGCDCLSQRVVALIAPEFVGNGPFTWATVPYLSVVYSVLTTPWLRGLDKKYMTLYNDVYFQGTVDVRSGLWLSHHWSNSGMKVSRALIEQNWDKVVVKMERRYARMYKQLNDPTAKPLLVWVGLGVMPDPHLSLWKKVSGLNVEGHWYDLEEAKNFLVQMRKAFPADIRMLYIAGDEHATHYDTTYGDAYLIAARIPVTYKMRIGAEMLFAQKIRQNLELWQYVKPADTYAARLQEGWKESDSRSLILEDEGGANCVTLDLKARTGHCSKVDIDEFDILEYEDHGSITMKYRNDDHVETWDWEGDNHWRQRK